MKFEIGYIIFAFGVVIILAIEGMLSGAYRHSTVPAKTKSHNDSKSRKAYYFHNGEAHEKS
jgi:hypothetical protein